MRLDFCDYHICKVMERLFETDRPLDQTLSEYFRAHKSIGAHDRRTIGSTLYRFIRYKSLFFYISQSNDPKDLLYALKKFNFNVLLERNDIPKIHKLGVNDFFYNLLISNFGQGKAEELCQILNSEAPVTIRANGLKITRDELIQKLKNRFALFPTKESSMGVQFKKREALFSTKEFQNGYFEMQDEGSQLIADLVKVQPKEHFLDYCSGSGGKTLAIAPLMEGKGQIYLYDIRPWALKDARKRLKRAGVQNAQFTLPRKKVDWLLLDVPCSGTGTFRRNPDAKWKFNEDMLARLLEEQRKIVAEALPLLKPGGKLVYATCSLLPAENEEQVQFILQQHPLTLEKEVSFFPEKGGKDGFFAAVFKKQPML